jgi:hypothetical protein
VRTYIVVTRIAYGVMEPTNDESNSMLRFIVNGIDSKFIPDFMLGLNERTATYLATPSNETVAAVDAWVSEWLVSAALLQRRSFLTAATNPPDDTPTSGEELRRRVHAKRASVYA